MSIQATRIRKTFGQTVVLDDVDLNVPRGKLVALLGPSGSGKTTLLRIIAGLEHADPGSGKILFHGEDVTDVPAGRRKVGFVFQHYALFRHMTVFENIAFGLNVRRRRDRPSQVEIAERVHRLLKLVQLEGMNERYPTQLSGGQRQRIALARALAVEPRVLLLDEPFGALDAKVRKDLRRWLRQFHDEVHLTTVFVTHDQEEALEIADEVVIMNQARVEQVGTPQEVYDRPASPFVYRFLGNVNVLRAEVLADSGLPLGRAVSLEDDGQLFVRPHDIQILPHAAGVVGIAAVVRYVHAAGPQARVSLEQVRTREPVEAEISRVELESLHLKVGDLVALRLRSGHSFGEDYAI
ncbi:sulfate ABC transporter ATP-binding protein [Opitutus sp. ER46]|uniref:sulfate/molybdate ABC transporter ATP-binding protein n=1 Tax=Opitutus sp. ER46 TaxID=2161864 RepID=UPI000D3139E7|nr:sulfate ABC transporter ATP-binding protein [Opitutus sp. ER46]PTX96388.1 sulfate ABC transporter ATP-binding protein [Opitutus sp. ER46]